MKELTIEQKAQRYDEILARAKAEYAKFEGMLPGDVLEDVIHELKESEDEKIRKELISYFQEEIPQCSIQEHADKMKEFIAWLEKQSKLNSVNKVESKFHVGDWVVISTIKGDTIVQIASVEYFKDGNPYYITTEGRWFGNGTKASLLPDKVEPKFQKQWKPTEEQVMYLAAAVEESNENPILDSLYHDLKELIKQ